MGAPLAEIGADATADDIVSAAAEAAHGEAAAAVSAAVDRLLAIDEPRRIRRLTGALPWRPLRRMRRVGYERHRHGRPDARA